MFLSLPSQRATAACVNPLAGSAAVSRFNLKQESLRDRFGAFNFFEHLEFNPRVFFVSSVCFCKVSSIRCLFRSQFSQLPRVKSVFSLFFASLVSLRDSSPLSHSFSIQHLAFRISTSCVPRSSFSILRWNYPVASPFLDKTPHSPFLPLNELLDPREGCGTCIG